MIGAMRLAAAFLMSGTVLAGTMAAAAETRPIPSITVSGEASAEVAPDIAHLSLGVGAERPTAAAATAAMAAATQAVMAQLKADAVPDTDVQTTALSLVPVYPDNQSSRPSPQDLQPTGFRAGTTILITIHPAEKAGLIASHLVDKGANTIEGIDYAASDEDARLDGLRADAMRDALRKAQIYVGALGLHLGRVLEITPAGSFQPEPMAMQSMAAARAAKVVVPTAPGLLRLQTGVTVRWEIAP